MTITLATLKDATAQQVFSQVANHLLNQKARSVREGGHCVYRGPNGLKCAAGCLIADKEYKPEMDGSNSDWEDVVSRFSLSSNHKQLIKQLQQAHDAPFSPGNEVEMFRQVRMVGERYKLDTSMFDGVL